MNDGEEEAYDFEYSDDDEEEPDVEVENAYYAAKSRKAEDTDGALIDFEKVIRLENERQQGGGGGEWGFKALKQMIKLLFTLGRHDEMLVRYIQLLDDFASTGAITQNTSEKGIDSILDHISSSSNLSLLHSLYETTLARLAARKNERLWFKTNLKLGHLLRDTGDLGRLQRVIKELLKCCETNPGDLEGADVIKRGTQLIEVYALQIQLCSLRRDSRKLKDLYLQALRITWGVPHPRTLGVIQECGGKMYMSEKEYDQAVQAFFQSFKCYDEAGEPRRLIVLKYLVLASMLHQSKIDPFDSQEAKPYKDAKEVVVMRNLIQAFQNDDVMTFERLLKEHGSSIMGDEYIRSHIDELLTTIRTQVLMKVITPYQRISLAYLAQEELNGIEEEAVESLLVSLILDQKIEDAYIDQVERILVKGKAVYSSCTTSSSTSSKAMEITSIAGEEGRYKSTDSSTRRSCNSRVLGDFDALDRWVGAVGKVVEEKIGGGGGAVRFGR